MIKVKPQFQVSERELPSVGSSKPGDKLNLILNFKVVEKTKSYVMLKITHALPVISKRSF